MNTQKGILKTIVLIIIGIAILAYFGINASDIIESKPVQVTWNFFVNVWGNYVAPAVSYIWNNIIVGFIWEGVTGFFQDAGSEINAFEEMQNATSTVN